MANGDCPIGAGNRADIENLKADMRDIAGRLRRVEIDMERLKTQMAGYAAAGAFLASVLVQVVFRLIG